MSLPLWDPIELPPDFTLVDVNSIEPLDLQQRLQGDALQLWTAETGEELGVREWSDDEGIFAVYDEADEIVGVTIITDVEDA